MSSWWMTTSHSSALRHAHILRYLGIRHTTNLRCWPAAVCRRVELIQVTAATQMHSAFIYKILRKERTSDASGWESEHGFVLGLWNQSRWSCIKPWGSIFRGTIISWTWFMVSFEYSHNVTPQWTPPFWVPRCTATLAHILIVIIFFVGPCLVVNCEIINLHWENLCLKPFPIVQYFSSPPYMVHCQKCRSLRQTVKGFKC